MSLFVQPFKEGVHTNMYGGWALDFSEASDPTGPQVLPAAIFCEAAFAEVLSPAEGEAGRGITIFATPPSTLQLGGTIRKGTPLVARGPGVGDPNVLDSAGISRLQFLQQRRFRSWPPGSEFDGIVGLRLDAALRAAVVGRTVRIRWSTSFRTRNTGSSSDRAALSIRPA